MTIDDMIWLARWLDDAGIKPAQAPSAGEDFENFKLAYGLDDLGFGEIGFDDLVTAFSILSDYMDGICY
jgi:hypothetical protein